VVVTMPIKFFSESPGLTSALFIFFALVIVFAVLQASQRVSVCVCVSPVLVPLHRGRPCRVLVDGFCLPLVAARERPASRNCNNRRHDDARACTPCPSLVCPSFPVPLLPGVARTALQTTALRIPATHHHNCACRLAPTSVL
jgi:hypothetical protein